MRKLILFSSLAFCLGFSIWDPTISPEERVFAAQYMKETRDALVKDVQGLTEAQLNFRSSPESWSIALCIEHIAIAETNLMDSIQKQLKAPADPSKRIEVKAQDTAVLRVVTDRSHKSTAPEFLKPSGKFANSTEALQVFLDKRNKNIEYIMNTRDDLRNHYQFHRILGRIDDFQGFLLIAAHCRRHTLQIEEVMADPHFPSK